YRARQHELRKLAERRTEHPRRHLAHHRVADRVHLGSVVEHDENVEDLPDLVLIHVHLFDPNEGRPPFTPLCTIGMNRSIVSAAIPGQPSDILTESILEAR